MEKQYLQYSRAFVMIQNPITIDYRSNCDIWAEARRIDKKVVENHIIDHKITDFTTTKGFYLRKGKEHHILLSRGLTPQEIEFAGSHEEGHLLQSLKLAPSAIDMYVATQLAAIADDHIRSETEANLWALLMNPTFETDIRYDGFAEAQAILKHLPTASRNKLFAKSKPHYLLI